MRRWITSRARGVAVVFIVALYCGCGVSANAVALERAIDSIRELEARNNLPAAVAALARRECGDPKDAELAALARCELLRDALISLADIRARLATHSDSSAESFVASCRIMGDLAMQRARINEKVWKASADAEGAEEMLALVAEAASALDVDRELMTAARTLLTFAPPSIQPSPQARLATVVNVTAELAVTPQGTLDAYKRSIDRLEHGYATSLALVESASEAQPNAVATDDVTR